MMVLISLLAVIILAAIPFVGVTVVNLSVLFGLIVPYLALITFIAGVVYRVVQWASAPVPFRITTTCGQQKTLSWIKADNLESPHNTLGVIGRMALEILFFRSLFRNTKSELKEGQKIVYGSDKWLWAAGLAFHYTFLVIILRHLRYFTEPVPAFVRLVDSMDGLFQIGLPTLYLTDIIFVGALTYLFLRRVVIPQVRYISLASDYFPLFLILGIGTTGLLMRYFFKTDIVGVKQLAVGLATFQFTVPDNIGALFYVHIFLVSVLLAYFPFSKLMHLGGVFLSPTRNLANDNRMRRHVNPWDYPVKVHTYEEYEDEFREKMKGAGIPVDKE
ncbi:MAG: sulfate reduction electron transfer complex DsrMKJOP subunit DsrM [bacterium]